MTEKDFEENNHQQFKALIEENIAHERHFWPGLEAEDTSPFNLLFFFINLLILPTGFTYFLEQKESHDEFICRHHI